MSNRVYLEVDSTLLKNNFLAIKKRVRPCQVMGVLKANAYGLGVKNIAQILLDAGMENFGVANINEALELRKLSSTCKIQILGGVLTEEITVAIKNDIMLPIVDSEIVYHINQEAKAQNKIAKCQILIDSGMGRLGLLIDEAFDIIQNISQKYKNCQLEGIYSHFPSAYSSDNDYSLRQISNFKALLAKLTAECGINFKYIHIANSDGINNIAESRQTPFNMVRSGINLYGLFDQQGLKNSELKPVISLKSRLISIRQMKQGSYIGYGCSYKLPKDSVVGTVCAGYADGLPMELSNRGYMLINDRLCPVIGRVSMDYVTILLDEVAEKVKLGDTVTCLGGKGFNSISAEQWSQLKGSHAYDVICALGNRVQRIYV
ncbi:alanine racemase [Lentisphaerota bacterium WC36G]|nr:alanine racemase [Lentisphaerae bacterium WC36]